MAVCDLLDWRCIFVSELIGNVVIATIVAIVIYLIIASKMKFGFDTTITFGIVILLVSSLAFSGFPVVYAFASVLIGFMIAWVWQQIFKN